MGKSPAQRAKEERRAERLAGQQAAAVRHHRRRRISVVMIVLALAAMVVSGLVGGLLNASNNSDDIADQSDDTATSLGSIAPPAELTVPPLGAEITGETPCPAADGSEERVTTFEQAPPMCIDPTNTYQAVVHTSVGDLTFLLDPERSPNTVNNFVVLSRYHFYDGVPFYTIMPRQVVVTGDATGDPELGKGGPGYTIDDEIPEAGVIYPVGSLAMWTDEPDQNGSRFLIAAGEDAAALPPVFTNFGIMLDGLETLNEIEFVGDPVTGNPVEEIVITSIDIIEEPADEEADATTTAPVTAAP